MDIERFVEDCVKANKESEAQAAIKDVLARAVSDPNGVVAALGEPTRAGINVIHRSDTLTIFNATWTPQMNLMPHNHLMWANIGIYTGRMVGGSMGTSERLEYNVHGDTVNTAARLENVNKQSFEPDFLRRPCRIYVGDTTKTLVEETGFNMRSVGRLDVVQ